MVYSEEKEEKRGKKEFWALIEESKKYINNNDKKDFLIKKLMTLGIDDIIAFETCFRTFYKDTYRSSLWGAAYIIKGGCSDDSFDYFRAWLIAQGMEVYHNAIKNPECLADYLESEEGNSDSFFEFEELLYVSLIAYEKVRTGNIIVKNDLYDEFSDLIEKNGFNYTYAYIDDVPWEDTEDLKMLFPKLCSKYEV